MEKLMNFSVKKVSDNDNYYGFELNDDSLYLTSDRIIHHNSGKSVLEQAIIGHVSRNADKFQVVVADCKRVDFVQDAVQKKCKAVLTDHREIASAAIALQKLMMTRFKLMENYQVNNV